MSIISGIKNFVCDVLGAGSAPEVESAQRSNKNEPVIKCENAGTNEDILKISNRRAQPKPDSNPQRSMGQIKQSIKVKCEALGIDYVKICRKAGEVANVSKEEFDAMPADKQAAVLLFFEHAIDHYAKVSEKHGSSADTNEVELIAADAKNKYEAVQNGDFASAKELEEEAGDVNNEFGKDFKKKPVKQRRAIMDGIACERKEKFEADLQEKLSRLPEGERASAEARMRRRFRHLERARFIDTNTANNSETGLNAIAMLTADDMGYGMKLVVKTRVDEAEATRTADMAKLDFTEGLMKNYYERGEKPEAQAVREYTRANIGAKSKDAVTEYQNDYNAKRQAYESGADVPEYLSEEFFTSTAKGIGEGALENVNMTADEKAGFISKWEDDAKQYKDYEAVTSDVKKALGENPEYKDISDKVKEIRKEKSAEKTNKTSSAEIQKEDNNAGKTDSGIHIAADYVSKTVESQKSQKSEIKNEQSTDKKTYSFAAASTNSAVFTKTIKSEGLSEAIKKYSTKEVISQVLDNQNLKYLRPQLATIIKSYDINTLKNISQNCSDSAFVYICGIINDEFVNELKNNRQHLCFAAAKQLENIEGNNV